MSIGDDRVTAHYENELESIDCKARSQAEIWQCWTSLIKKSSSYQAIHTYLITEFKK